MAYRNKMIELTESGSGSTAKKPVRNKREEDERLRAVAAHRIKKNQAALQNANAQYSAAIQTQQNSIIQA